MRNAGGVTWSKIFSSPLLALIIFFVYAPKAHGQRVVTPAEFESNDMSLGKRQI